VLADVADPTVERHRTVWKGSCVELFGSLPGTFAIGQVFLAPAAGDTPAAGYRAEGTDQVPEPGIRIASQTIEGGYRLSALVPVALLRLDAPPSRFLLECQVSSNPSGKARIYGTLFGSERAYENNARYGLFALDAGE
jgi:hypothetical protein